MKKAISLFAILLSCFVVSAQSTFYQPKNSRLGLSLTKTNTTNSTSSNNLHKNNLHENDLYPYKDPIFHGAWGLCDYYGNVVIPPKYLNISTFSSYDITPISEWIAVRVDGNYGFIDRHADIKIGFKYKSASNFHYGHAAVQDETGKWGLINENGEYVFTPQFSGIVWREDYDNVWICYKNSSKGLIDKSGRLIAQPQFFEIYGVSEGLACVKQNGKCGYIDKLGNVVIGFEFDYANPFSEGLAWVGNETTSGFTSGYIDKTGHYSIPPRYAGGRSFSEGLAAVSTQKGSGFGFIDKSGRIVIQPQFILAYPFKEGLSCARIGPKWGFIDKSGKFVIQPEFNTVMEEFSHGFAVVGIKKSSGKELFGVINKSGLYVVLPEYRKIYYFKEGVAFAQREEESGGSTFGYIDYNGNFYKNLPEAFRAVHKKFK